MGVDGRVLMGQQQFGSARVPVLALRALAGLVVLGQLTLAAFAFLKSFRAGAAAPEPFVWPDVAVMHVLCAVPLAWLLAALLVRRARAGAALLLALMLFGIGVLPFHLGPANLLTGTAGSWGGLILRAATALDLSVAAALAVAVLRDPRLRQERHRGWANTLLLVGGGIAVLLLLPATYVDARCRHDVVRLGELLEQSRLGEARALVGRLLALNSQRQCQGRPLPQIAADLEQFTAGIEARVSVPLPANAGGAERLERARQFAILGRNACALDELQLVRESAVAPDADLLRGTIQENEETWPAALESYRSARAAWGARPPAARQQAGLLRATLGVAYCQRKLGSYAEAEATYRQAFLLAPTADTHFLLAQFYEDTQQADKALEHARRAMALAPERYRLEGEKLIRRLTVSDFSCLRVFSAQKQRSGAALLLPAGREPCGQGAARAASLPSAFPPMSLPRSLPLEEGAR